MVASLDPPVPLAAVSVTGATTAPRRVLRSRRRAWAGSLSRRTGSRSTCPRREGGVIALGLQGIDGDEATGEVEGRGHRAEGDDLVLVVIDLCLGDDDSLLVGERGQKVDGPAVLLDLRHRRTPPGGHSRGRARHGRALRRRGALHPREQRARRAHAGRDGRQRRRVAVVRPGALGAGRRPRHRHQGRRVHGREDARRAFRCAPSPAGS